MSEVYAESLNYKSTKSRPLPQGRLEQKSQVLTLLNS